MTMRIAEATRWAGVGLQAFATVARPAFGETGETRREDPDAILRAQREERLQQVESDRTAYAASIVARWEESAREAGRWDKNFSSDLLGALLKLDSENLLAAGEASSYPGMMT